MSKQIIRAVTALFVLCFAASAMAEFPTSLVQYKQDWTRINEEGFKGTLEEACSLNGLTADECATFNEMRSAGKCTEYEQIPAGTVFDSMVFTRDGSHRVMHNVRAKLSNPEQSDSTVCQIGTKAVILPHWCDNLAVVNDSKTTPKLADKKADKKAYQVRGPRPGHNPYGACPGGDPDRRYFGFRLYEAFAASQQCAIDHMLPGGGYLGKTGRAIGWGNPDAFSIQCESEFRQLERSNVIEFASKSYEVEIIITVMTVIDQVNLDTFTEVDWIDLQSRLSENDHQITYDGRIYSSVEYLLFEGEILGDTLIPKSEKDKEVMADDGKHIFIPEEFFFTNEENGNVRELTEEELENRLLTFRFKNPSEVQTPAPSGVSQFLSDIKKGDCAALLFAGIKEMPVTAE